MIVTIPLGENPYLDRMLVDGRIRFTELYAMKRVDRNRWQGISFEEAVKVKNLNKNANIVIIGILKK